MYSSADIVALLRKAGWHEGRRIDIGEIMAVLSGDGYQIFDAARVFLTEFGNLQFQYPRQISEHETFMYDINLDPIQEASHIFSSWVKLYEKYAHEKLVIIGNCHRGHLCLLISETGKTYGGYDDFFILLGSDLYDALDALMNHKEAKKIEISDAEFK